MVYFGVLDLLYFLVGKQKDNKTKNNDSYGRCRHFSLLTKEPASTKKDLSKSGTMSSALGDSISESEHRRNDDASASDNGISSFPRGVARTQSSDDEDVFAFDLKTVLEFEMAKFSRDVVEKVILGELFRRICPRLCSLLLCC